MNQSMDWADNVPNTSKFFKIVEGDNRFQLLTHLAPYALKWNGSRYEPAEEGDKNVSWKGVGYVLQDDVIKEATLPYTVVKAIKGLMDDPDYAFEEFPMPRLVNVKAVGAGTKEVEYNLIPSPKETNVPVAIITELAGKPSPEELVNEMRKEEKATVSPSKNDDIKYPEAEINPEDVPF